MTKRFQRKIENFKCDHCGKEVTGSGYTNHCPECLWSKHVDIFPGDRGNECKGMMRPVDAFQKTGKWWVVQQCEKCGEQFRVKLFPEDSLDVVEDILRQKT